MRETEGQKSRKGTYSIIAALIALLLGGGYGATQLPQNTAADVPVVEVQNEQVIAVETEYAFRNDDLLEQHYEKHGIEMGFDDAQSYVDAANRVIASPDVLHKIEAEDGDDVYYLESTNEFVVVSIDGYLRTYFCPSDGLDYFNRQ